MDALILAGGENKRLSVLKGFIEIKGKRIIESNIELLSSIFDRVIISTNNPEIYFYLGVPMVGDILKYRGPMTGILSVLISLEVPEIFVTACDMPFIKPELIRYIIDKYSTPSLTLPPRGGGQGWEKWDAVIPIFDKKPQPLLGIYSRRIAGSMEESIKQGEKSLKRFLQGMDVLYIDEEEVRIIDPEGRSFININTMEDYEKIVNSE
ncbi:MAG: molybdenum cofactor guanylyltransferase [Nitrospirae bacterium]|nr:molybdenum cofactor guanylyltransferase [Nitrospirota bacterium]